MRELWSWFRCLNIMNELKSLDILGCSWRLFTLSINCFTWTQTCPTTSPKTLHLLSIMTMKSSKSSHLRSWNQQMFDIYACKMTEIIKLLFHIHVIKTGLFWMFLSGFIDPQHTSKENRSWTVSKCTKAGRISVTKLLFKLESSDC